MADQKNEPRQDIVSANTSNIKPVEDQDTDEEKVQRYIYEKLMSATNAMNYAAFMGYPDQKMPEPTEEILKRLAVRGIRPERQGRKK